MVVFSCCWLELEWCPNTAGGDHAGDHVRVVGVDVDIAGVVDVGAGPYILFGCESLIAIR